MLLPLSLLIGCIGAMVFGIVTLFNAERAMRLDRATNMVWVIGQAEVETLRLDAALARNPPADVALRHDLLVRRLSLLCAAPQRRRLQDYEGADEICAAGERIAGQSLDGALHNTALARDVDTLRDLLHRASTQAMTAEWEALSQRLENHRAAVTQVMASLAGAVLAAIYLGWRGYSNQNALLRAETTRLHALELERDLERERVTSTYWRDFAAVVSHQFRTPLAVIDSAAQRLLRRGRQLDTAALAEKQATIRQMVAAMGRMVDTALISGEVENDRRPAECAAHDLVPLLGGLVAEIAPRAAPRKILLRVEAPRAIAWCDPHLVLHIVINLIENALRHTPGPAPVILRLEPADEGWALSVADSGPGIADEELPHIFERFRTRADGGSGLGLWIARRLAEMQGGRLTVQSASATGSVFTLHLTRTGAGEEGTA